MSCFAHADDWPGNDSLLTLSSVDWRPIQRGCPGSKSFEAVRDLVRAALAVDPIVKAAVEWASERDEEERLGLGGHQFEYDYERNLYDAVKATGLLNG